MVFLPGKHTFNVIANISSVTSFSMFGGSANTTTIVCSGLRCGGFSFDNVTGLNVTQLSFVSDSHSIITRNVYGFQLVNCIFANSSNTAIIANNSNLHIEGNTFINNTGGAVQQMIFIPGGGIAVISSTMTLRGKNNFLNLACAADFCGGGAIYAENSTVDLAGNTTFINNTAASTNHSSFIGGGGGLLLFNTAVSITGHVHMANNSVSNTYSVANKCEVGGGGVSLILCNATINGKVVLVNNMAKGQSGCGGGIYAHNSNVSIHGNKLQINNSTALLDIGEANMAISTSHTSNAASFGGEITVNVLLTGNHAGYAGGGIHMENGNFTISGTVSVSNNSVGTFDSPYSFGGGYNTFGIVYLSVTGNLVVTGNHAAGHHGQGGGLNVMNSIINVTGLMSLANNSADYCGGGIKVGGCSMTVSGNISFINNSATALFPSSGGGIFTVGSNITLTNALFANNHAAYQGGGINAQNENIIMLTRRVTFIDNSAGFAGGGVVLIGSTMKITTEASLTNNSAVTFGGGIVIRVGSMTVSGSVLLADNYAGNYGGGLSVNGGIINVTGTMSLFHNSAGVYGAGITMNGSNIHITASGKVYFIGNEALAAAAIYVKDPSSIVYCALDVGAACVTENCFFQIGENPLVGHKLIVFEDNVAVEGSVLYGGSLDRCVLEGHPEADSGQVFDMIANYSLQLQTNSIITSYPYRVCLCNDLQPCSASKTFTAYAYPGQTIPIRVAAVGQRNGTRHATINAITNPSNPSNRSTLGRFEDRQDVTAECTELHYTFFSQKRDLLLILYVDGSCSSLDGSTDRLQISVQLLHCPVAFTLSKSTSGCICEDRLQMYTNRCYINTQKIQRDGDFWVGYDNQSKGLILHPHCPFDYCEMKPTNFTMDNTDLQCSYNRTGLLCGACPPDLSLALGSSRCLPCSDAYLSLLLPFATMGLMLVVFMLLCRLTVALGTINGLIFYANIVGANQSAFFPSGNINFLRVFISWLNLDLGIETCFYDGMDAYVKTWLKFVFPIYIWGVIALIMFISAHSPRVSRMLGSNPVAVLATLFLLSYAKILRDILSALSITTLEYPHDKMQVVWLSDGNITYLHGKHIPLFVVGILFLVFIFLPYTLLLLLGQWLQKFSHIKVLSWMNNLKLKAFLEAYYAPYMIKHRYWTGLLLVARLVLLPVFAINALGDNSENLLAISAASFSLLVWPLMIGNIYKNWKLRALNTSYILNLGIFAIATNYVQQAGGNQAVVTYISTGIAFITFLATVLGHLYFQIKGSGLLEKLCCKTNEQQPDNQHPEAPAPIPDPQARPLIAPCTTYIGYGVNKFREPLLDAQ